MKAMYPDHAWYHQGIHRQHERGLDLIGTHVGDRPAPSGASKIGVQVKLHAADHAPGGEEWQRFFAGCFLRRIDLAVFVTTGRLSGGQRAEASEANAIVIAGKKELTRLARRHGLAAFRAPPSDEGRQARRRVRRLQLVP